MGNNIFAPLRAAKREYPHLSVKAKRTNFFLLAASTSALAVAMPGAASAQAVPAGCTPNPANNGDVVTCVAPPTPITGISTTVDDLTINIGNTSTPTTVNEAAGDGINMRGGGFQAINIYNAASSVTGSDEGIDIRVLAGGGDITITSQGSISGGDQGIEVYNLGAGSLTIDVIDVTGTTRDGIFARNYGAGISVTSTGTVSGGDEGVTAVNDGSGDLTINLNNVYGGAAGYGLTAINNAGGNNLNITATGTISGGAGGLLSQNSGAGNFTINVNNVYGVTSDGIFATNTAAGMNLSITASGTVSGGTFGVRARNSGSGALTIDVVDVSGGSSTGILATNLTATTTDITVTSTGTINGSTGIQADNYGTGSTTINVVDVTGATGYGILAVNRTSGLGTDVTVTSTGDVMGVVTGILGDNYGSGALTINAMNVTGTGAGADGIRGVNRSPGTDLSITALGIVSGGDDGIDAFNAGAGDISITTAGAVTGTAGDGIVARNYGFALSIITGAGAITGGADGIDARNNGTAGLTITVGGDVTGTNGQGINAYNSANDVSASMVINQAAGTVTTGATDGIFADNAGGSLTINALGTSIGQAGDGIYADNNTGATNLTIIANNATGSDDGIEARNFGTGALSITTNGAVTGVNNGIEASNAATATDLAVTVNAGSVVTGNADEGLYTNNNGTGTTAITINGTVNSTTAEGIEQDDAAGSGAVTITVGATGVVTGGLDGIESDADGVGDLTVTVNGSVTGNSDGLDIDNDGSGNIIVVTGVGSYVRGVNYEGVETDISTVGGTTSITVNGTVIGGEEGIEADDATDSGAMTITTGANSSVTGGNNGIDADHDGTGALTITTNGSVTGGAGYDGILANNSAAGTSLTIEALSAVSGGTNGINALNYGTAGLTVTVAGDVTGLAGRGINAYNSANDVTASMVINQAAGSTIAGATDGIFADNFGGSLTINALGTVTGAAGDGINADNNVGTTDLTITANTVTGSNNGIRALNYGTGTTSVTTTGVVTGTTGFGIFTYNSTTGTSLTVDAQGDVSGGSYGIVAFNFGSDALSVTSQAVTGTTGDGISARNAATGTSLTVDAGGDVLGGSYGIIAINLGSGALSVTSQAVTGIGNSGVYAFNNATGTSLTIDAQGAVSGGTDGIYASNSGSGALSVTVSDVVTGGTGYGIRTSGTAPTTITLNAGADVSSAAGLAIFNDAGDSTTTVNTGATVTGAISLNDGSDDLVFAGGDFSGVTTFDGGDDISTADGFIDTLTFAGSSGAVTGANVVNWENVVIGAGSTISFDDNLLVTSNLMINAGGTLNAADGSSLTAMVTNSGTLNIGNSPGAFTINGDFVQTSTGVLPIEIDGAANDLLIVTGDVTLGGTLDVTTALGGLSVGATTRTIIDGGGTLSGAFDSVNNGLLIAQTVTLDIANTDVLLTTSLNPASSIAGLSVNQTNLGDNLISLLSDPGLDPALVNLIGAVGSVSTSDALAAVLDGLHPEGLDMGLKFLASSQTNFVDLVIGQSTGNGGAGPVQIASLSGGPVSVSRDDGPNVWAAFQASGMSQSSDAQNIGFDGRTLDFAAGVSGIGRGPVTFGIAGGYSDFSGDSDGSLGDEIDSQVYRIAVSMRAKLNIGGDKGVNTYVDSVVSYADGDSDFVMNLTDPASMTLVSQAGSADISSFDWLTRFTVDGTSGRVWPIKPHVQIGVNGYKQSAVNIGASSATALVVDELSNTRAQVGIGATYEYQWNDRMNLRARVTGVQYFGDTENIFSSRFASAPAGTVAFQTFGKEVKRQVELEAGFAYAMDSGITVSVGAFGEVGDLNIYGGNVRLSKGF